MNNLRDRITTELENADPNHIVGLMGYNNKSAGIEHLYKALSDDQLGFGKGLYDGHYSNREFIKKLLEVLGIDYSDYEDDLNEIEMSVNDDNFGFRPYIFIDTAFKRDGQPIFALAFMEGHRYLVLDKKIKKLSRREQIKVLTEAVKLHQKKTDGVIKMWGKAVQYAGFLNEKDIVLISPQGVVIAEQEKYERKSVALITL